MKTINTLTIFLLLTICTNLLGQSSNNLVNESPYIEVTGTAEKEITPDEIYISITIKERMEGKEKITIEQQAADLQEALTSINVPIENLSLSEANANYIRLKWSKKDVIKQNEYVLKVKDAVTVGKVYEKLDDLKILDAYIARVSHSKIEELKKGVRIMAIEAAKDKADYLLSAIGEKPGKPLIVKETKASPISNVYGMDDFELYNRYEFNALEMDYSNDKIKAIEFSKIKLQSSIYVKFLIE